MDKIDAIREAVKDLYRARTGGSFAEEEHCLTQLFKLVDLDPANPLGETFFDAVKAINLK